MSDFFNFFYLAIIVLLLCNPAVYSIVVFTAQLYKPPENMRIDVHGYADNRREPHLRQPPYQYTHARLQTTITPQITANSRRNRNLPKDPSPFVSRGSTMLERCGEKPVLGRGGHTAAINGASTQSSLRRRARRRTASWRNWSSPSARRGGTPPAYRRSRRPSRHGIRSPHRGSP